jgi:hypothetical protein
MPNDLTAERGRMTRIYEVNCGVCGKVEYMWNRTDALRHGMRYTKKYGWVHKSCREGVKHHA